MLFVKPPLTFPLTLLLLLLPLQLANSQHQVDKNESPQSLTDKQQDTDATISDEDWLSARTMKETVTGSGEKFYPEEDDINQSEPRKADARRKKQRRKNKFSKSEAKRRSEEELAIIKSKMMQDFAREHGEKIRRSRRHANLFDGSGYLLDHLEELKEYQSRAEQHQQQQRRKRRSTDDNANNAKPSTLESSDFIFEDLPEFSSLKELIDHLNEVKQADIVTPGLNLQFFEQKQRKKRSITDDVDDDNDWGRERDAQASVHRLDEMLKDLAQYLDLEHLDAEEDAKDQQQQQQQQFKPLAGYNRQLLGAHKALVQLRDMLVTATASGRMSSMHVLPDKTANWQVDTEALRENVQKLRNIYRQMDEL